MDIQGPIGSQNFGGQVQVLPNGNILVVDPNYNSATATKAGAVYLYHGETLALISTLTGSNANDQIGSGGVTILSTGHFVVSSPNWNLYRGAATWGSGVTGISGIVSAENSLVGSNGTVGGGDTVGSQIVALSNGNYIVLSPVWGNAQRLGAATWANGATGITGPVSAANSLVGGEYNAFVGASAVLLSNGNFVVRSLNAGKGAVTWGSATLGLPIGTLSEANSLVGSRFGDAIGSDCSFESCGKGIVPLDNGNYVVVSVSWDNGAIVDAGAVTWGNGAAGTSGVVAASNSLVGSRTYDNVGFAGTNVPGIVALANGNFVVISYLWDSRIAADVGAVTWVNGVTGLSGPVSTANSLVGSKTNDWIGFGGVTALANGNFTAASPYWDNGAIDDAGAVTWGNGTTGLVGTISPANSLVGDASGDLVGWYGVVALPNGNYLARSPDWHADRGAVTWGNGATGLAGAVSAANSLVGRSAYDTIGFVDINAPKLGVTVLSNGNYVVASPYWRKNDGGPPADYAGAVTWGSAATGIAGEVSAANSFIGSSSHDKIGMLREGNPYASLTALSGVIPLHNGHFVVASAYWDNGASADAGAITWVDGATGGAGIVSAANSLVGSAPNDKLGTLPDEQPSIGIVALRNGNYVVASPYWDNGPVADAGAVTWGNGATGASGAVSSANSLVGSGAYDWAGARGVTPLANNHYIVHSPFWSNPATGRQEVGALTWGNGASGMRGVISSANSLVGSADFDWVGSGAATALSNGDFIAHSPAWDRGTTVDAGAVTWGNGASGTTGAINSGSSVLGTTAYQGETMTSQAANNNLRFIVGRDVDQIITVVERVPRLMVHLAGTGSGVVTSSPTGINCGVDCSEPFSHGTVVLLSATPAAGSAFAGWTGACTGGGACRVTMDSARTVTASFDQAPVVQPLLFLPLIQRQ